MIRLNLIGTVAVAMLCFSVGCNDAGFKSVAEVKKAGPAPEHEHGAKGPHGGGLIELGEEEYHAELVVDHDTHAIVVYVLGKDAKTAELVSATEVTITPEGKEAITLKASPQKDEPEGKTSKFELENDELVHTWIDAGFVHGEFRITIADKPYIGHIDYHMSGDHHDHDHDEKKPAADEKKHDHDEKKPEEGAAK